ncbi:MAG: regulatory protein GemA [Alphaproteobacteria bacterium]
MSLSRKQTALVHIAKKQLALTEDEYRGVLAKTAGVESCSELDGYGFEAVMQYFAALGFKSGFTESFFGHRPGRASPSQVGLIRKLWTEYTDGKGDDASLGKWLDRTFHISALRFLTAQDAPKAITALKAMKKGKARRDNIQ